jgi:hypothetical protein
MAQLSDVFAMPRVEPVPLSWLIQDILQTLYQGGMAVFVRRHPMNNNALFVYQNARWVEQSHGNQQYYLSQYEFVQRMLLLLRDTAVLDQVRLYGGRHTLDFPMSVASNCAAPGARVYPMSHIDLRR